MTADLLTAQVRSFLAAKRPPRCDSHHQPKRQSVAVDHLVPDAR
jgi:hypothetical protein